MQQFSIDGRQVQLEVLSGHLLFIDPLYFQEIAENYHKVDTASFLDKKELVVFIEKTFFPYADSELLGYKYVGESSVTFSFDQATLKKRDLDNVEENFLAMNKDISSFGVDTASFLIIDLDNLSSLIYLISFDGLVEAFLSSKLAGYFDAVNQKLGNKGWAFILSEGNDTENEFSGDGSYILP